MALAASVHGGNGQLLFAVAFMGSERGEVIVFFFTLLFKEHRSIEKEAGQLHFITRFIDYLSRRCNCMKTMPP